MSSLKQLVSTITKFYDKYLISLETNEIMHHNYEDSWWNNIPYEIECKGEIECYDKINELHPKYPVIIYNHARRYKQRLKKIIITGKVKV
ncbi:MAG TPA: hypothetical protein VEW92_06505 [Nitrososphaeraceae archaeon]|nr:hypothetical protein [Nitrososphaeraceae archaeon]